MQIQCTTCCQFCTVKLILSNFYYQFMKGKIILKYDKLGYIEYDIDSRVSYMVGEYPDFNIGAKVNFDIIEKRVTG